MGFHQARSSHSVPFFSPVQQRGPKHPCQAWARAGQTDALCPYVVCPLMGKKKQKITANGAKSVTQPRARQDGGSRCSAKGPWERRVLVLSSLESEISDGEPWRAFIATNTVCGARAQGAGSHRWLPQRPISVQMHSACPFVPGSLHGV